jgi:hypothetical protein
MIDKILKTNGGVDEFGDLGLIHLDVELLVPIGQFNSGEKFDVAAVCYETGTLLLQRDGEEHQFDMTLKIG